MASSSDSWERLLLVLNRLGYGPRADEYAEVAQLGINGWLEQQLNPPKGDDARVEESLNKVRLHIKYDAVPDKWPAVDEMRPLSSLMLPIDEPWAMFDQGKQINGQEKGRPRLDVLAATLTRAVYSKYQLREVMAQFWHDHFHVNAFSDDRISVALPTYDRDVIRPNCFGNFRQFLEAVATSTAMQYYLSNKSSRAGSANENYARELFELHTLGREAYLNDQYDRWREVPGATDGHPTGYIDQDVYESARAFTGWTIEDGAGIDGGRKLPSTGKFTYVENWHDGYQKRVLATEFDPFQRPMADGKKVLDLIAGHPATAKHLATKLCQRLIGPDAPPSIIARASDAWLQLKDASDQIGQVVRVIAQSQEFMQTRNTKVKRPLALMANYVRMMGYEFSPSEGLINQIANAGQKLYGAPTPAGLPDDNKFFIGSNAMRNRWQMLIGLAQNQWQNGLPVPSEALIAWGGHMGVGSELTAQWLRIFGVPADETLVAQVAVASGIVPFSSPVGGDGEKRMAMTAAIAAMSPEYQTC